MSGPVEAADIEALEDFYRSRDTEARILVSPFAHPSLLERLGERGFRLVDLDTILVRRLDPGESSPAPAGDAAVRRAGPEDAADWVRVSIGGFSGSAGGAPPERAGIFEAVFHAAPAAYFFASIGGAPAGTAAVHIEGATAHFFAASTQSPFRGRGAQGALIAARLAFARESGCDLAFTATAAGSASQRNFERCGFRPVYSQALLIKYFD
jgi:GNAT superfamily N-acetyltransferase